MGRATATAADNFNAREEANLAAADAATNWFSVTGRFNFTIAGAFLATVVIERSFDGGATAVVVARDVTGTAASFTGPVTLELGEIEADVLWRARLTTHSSGAARVRFSK